LERAGKGSGAMGASAASLKRKREDEKILPFIAETGKLLEGN